MKKPIGRWILHVKVIMNLEMVRGIFWQKWMKGKRYLLFIKMTNIGLTEERV